MHIGWGTFSVPDLELALNNQWFSKVAVWLVIALVLFTVFKQFDGRVVGGANYMALPRPWPGG